MPASSAHGDPTKVDGHSDRALLAAYAQCGDEEAFTMLVGRHAGLVTGVARRRTGDWHLADEVVQTTFSILARQAASLAEIESLASWLHRVAVRQSIRSIRQLVRQRRKLDQAMRHVQVHGEGRDPIEEVLPRLDEALEGLSESDRQLLFLRYYERLSFAEAAVRLERSEAALRQQVGRAMEKLSGALRRRGRGVSGAALVSALGLALAGPESSAAAAALIARSAWVAAREVGAKMHWNPTLFTMSTTQSILVGGAAVMLLSSVPLGWQHREISRLRVAQGGGGTSAREPTAGDQPAGGGETTLLKDGAEATLKPAAALSATAAAALSSAPSSPARPDSMDQILQGFVQRKAEAEADRTAQALGMSPEQTREYREYLEGCYPGRADASSDEDRARMQAEERQSRELFLTSLIGEEGVERYRVIQQRRDDAALEKAAGDALHSVASAVDLREDQKQRLFQALAAAARDASAAGARSLSLSFGYGVEGGRRLTADDSLLSKVLTPEQAALWQRHGPPDPDQARKALEVIAPTMIGDPDLWPPGSDSVPPAASSPSTQR